MAEMIKIYIIFNFFFYSLILPKVHNALGSRKSPFNFWKRFLILKPKIEEY